MILILESPEKCVKPQISVPRPRHLHSVGQCRGQAFARVTRPQMELLLPLLEPHREPRTCSQYSELFTLMESARLTGLISGFSSPPPFLSPLLPLLNLTDLYLEKVRGVKTFVPTMETYYTVNLALYFANQTPNVDAPSIAKSTHAIYKLPAFPMCELLLPPSSTRIGTGNLGIFSL